MSDLATRLSEAHVIKPPTAEEKAAWSKQAAEIVSAKAEMQRKLQANLDRHISKETKKDAASLGRYWAGMAKAVEDVPALPELKSYRLTLLGLYFEAGIKTKRKVGLPGDRREGRSSMPGMKSISSVEQKVMLC